MFVPLTSNLSLVLYQKTEKKYEVTVANGEKIQSFGRCKDLNTLVQGVPINVDFYLLPLEGCDVVLGAQWLSMLRPIIWDFSKLQMKFKLEEKDMY